MSFYPRLRNHRDDDEALQACIERVVDQLDNASDPKKPGMLLGKIQSGKTRAFLGIIARAFDRDFDLAIVLTKGTKTLASQTVKRIGRDFKEFIDSDEVLLFDIMSAPDPLTKAELRRKIVVVAKKQVQNLARIQELFDSKYPSLRGRRVLLVDDEADMASIRFAKKKGEDEFDQGTIANQMDQLRRTLARISFLQVTATPYALYLQPEDYEQASKTKEVFYPKRPAFTELLPIHDAYVGGDAYFGGHGIDDPRHYLYVEVSDEEHDALRSNDGRTVLQHSRMYGARPKADLAVTRFYTSRGVYVRLGQIHALETALREAFESGAHDGGVVFIQSDARGGIVPCAPTKVSLSDVIAVRANDMFLPTSFNTVASGNLKRAIRGVDAKIPRDTIGSKKFVEITLAEAFALIDAIQPTLVSDSEPEFDWDAMKGLLSYYALRAGGRVLLLAEGGRKLTKSASGDRSGISILGTAELRSIVRESTRTAPALVLLKQDGGESLGWKAGPFWWPMLASPPQATSCVFSTKVAS